MIGEDMVFYTLRLYDCLRKVVLINSLSHLQSLMDEFCETVIL